ncbi:MAG TPA: hypothetical protein VGL23_23360 [Chloroflexota bacterium]|jgi:hypothetical protein
MRRLVIIVGAVAAIAVVTAIALTAPTVVVAAPLWIMALCVLTNWRAAPPAEPQSSGPGVDRVSEGEAAEPRLTVLPGRPVGPAGHHAAG